MLEAERLFDPAPYSTAEEKRAATPKRSCSQPVEPFVEPWTVVRDRSGVKPYFHLVKARADTSAVITVCGAMGTIVHSPGVSQMIRCPVCDVGAQLM
jgi:hypothetical protein